MPPKSEDSAAGGEQSATLETATVARGTVVWGDGIASGPGETVQLSPEDIQRLRADGVLTDPDAAGPAAPAQNGPTVSAG
jgi:hypothetical protein